MDAGSDQISKGIRHFRETHDVPHIYFFKNLTPEDFLRLMIGSNCIVGNSSVSIREASFLGVPAVNIGSRQAGRDRGPNIIDAGYASEEILRAIERHLDNGKYPSAELYGDGKSGRRIADILAAQPLNVDKQLTY